MRQTCPSTRFSRRWLNYNDSRFQRRHACHHNLLCDYSQKLTYRLVPQLDEGRADRKFNVSITMISPLILKIIDIFAGQHDLYHIIRWCVFGQLFVRSVVRECFCDKSPSDIKFKNNCWSQPFPFWFVNNWSYHHAKSSARFTSFPFSIILYKKDRHPIGVKLLR